MGDFSGIPLPRPRGQPPRSPRDSPLSRPRDYTAVPVPLNLGGSHNSSPPVELPSDPSDCWKAVTTFAGQAKKFCSDYWKPLLGVSALTTLYCMFGSNGSQPQEQQGSATAQTLLPRQHDASWYTSPWTWITSAAAGYVFYDQQQHPADQSSSEPGLRPVKAEHAIGATSRSADTSEAKSKSKGGAWIWIVVAILLGLGVGLAAFFLCKSSELSYGDERGPQPPAADLENGRRRRRYHRRRR